MAEIYGKKRPRVVVEIVLVDEKVLASAGEWGLTEKTFRMRPVDKVTSPKRTRLVLPSGEQESLPSGDSNS